MNLDNPKFKKVIIPHNMIRELEEFVSKVVKEKINESHYAKDAGNMYKRFYTGFLGEMAIEQLLGVDIIDLTIGSSKYYNISDLSKIGLNMGIKTVELGKFPLVHKNPKMPEIINIKTENNTVYVCGIASKDMMRTYSDDKYVLSPALRRRGVKTGFYGFEHLHDINRLIRYCNR